MTESYDEDLCGYYEMRAMATELGFDSDSELDDCLEESNCREWSERGKIAEVKIEQVQHLLKYSKRMSETPRGFIMWLSNDVYERRKSLMNRELIRRSCDFFGWEGTIPGLWEVIQANVSMFSRNNCHLFGLLYSLECRMIEAKASDGDTTALSERLDVVVAMMWKHKY